MRHSIVTKQYRTIDFKRQDIHIGIVISIEWDPCRTSLIARIFNLIKKKSLLYNSLKRFKTWSDNTDTVCQKLSVLFLDFEQNLSGHFKIQMSTATHTHS